MYLLLATLNSLGVWLMIGSALKNFNKGDKLRGCTDIGIAIVCMIACLVSIHLFVIQLLR